MKMKINRSVGAARQRNTASIRRTVLYTAVVAAIGLFLAGLPVAGTTPTAQAQANQAQTEWHIVYPDLFNEGRSVEKNDLNQWWNNDVAWGRLSSTGAGFRGSDVYYTSASLGASTGNQATWYMGRRIGTQWMAVYIPGNIPRNNRPDFSFNARVKYEVILTDRSGAAETVEYTINQSEHNGREGKWFNLYHPQTGIEWVLNGDEVIIVVRNNEASPHYSHGSDPSRMGINAVAMKCTSAANCTTTSPPPPTTNPPPSSSGPRVSGLANELSPIVDHFPLRGFLADPVGGDTQDRFQVSPSSARVTAAVSPSVHGLEAQIDRSGGSPRLIVTTNGRVPVATSGSSKYKIVVTARVGSGPVTTRNIYVTVVKPKYRIKLEGRHNNKRLIAQRNFQTVDGNWVIRNTEGGIVRHQSSNLSHFDNSWIAKGAKVWSENVRVEDNALVKGRTNLRETTLKGSVKVYGNAQVYGNSSGNPVLEGFAQVFGNAKVFGNAQVAHRAVVAGNAWVYSNFSSRRTQVYDDAKVFGTTTLIHSGAKVYDFAHVSDAEVAGYPHTALVYESAWVYGGAKVLGGAVRGGGEARVYGTARLCEGARLRESDANSKGKVKVFGNAQVSNSALPPGNHGDGARYGGGCPDRTLPTPPKARYSWR